MRIATVAAAVSFTLFGVSVADEALASIRMPTRIEPQELGTALRDLAKERSFQVIYREEIVGDLRTAGAVGEYTSEEALVQLLNGTGLTYRYLDDKTVTITRIGVAPASSTRSGLGGDRDAGSFRLAQESQRRPEEMVAVEQSASEGRKEHVPLQEVIVTGSNIRGAETASPTIALTQKQMVEAGQTNLGEAIRSIPQNFAGGQNPGVIFGGGNIANQNATGGSTLNLRGLGPDATLTLLNGRRLPYDGFAQGVDISQIPLAAVERIEVVTDGASAIYGSDAVGGVANVILKRDFNGVSASARLGRATDGGNFQQQYGLTGGTTWQTGGFILTLDSERDSPIDADERDYARYLPPPRNLLGRNDAHSALFSGHQDFGDLASFELDALYTKRRSNIVYTEVSTIYTSLATTSDYSISPRLTFALPAQWRLSISGSHGEDHSVGENPAYSAVDGSLISNGKTCYCNAADTWQIDSEGRIVALPAGDVRAAVGGGYRSNAYDQFSYLRATGKVYGKEHSYYGFAELNIPLVSPTLDVRGVRTLALNGAVRYERYSAFDPVTTPKIGIVYAPTADLDLKASWGKSFKTPTLKQRYEATFAELFPIATFGATGYPANATTLFAYGGNRDLNPERATSWTATASLHPEALPDLQASASYFHIDYNDRILLPIDNVAAAFRDPKYQQFLDFDPTLAKQQALFDSAGANYYNFTGAPYDPATVVAMMNDVYLNVASQRIHGIDLSASYRFHLEASALTVSEDASRIDSRQQNSAGQPYFALAGTVYNPPHWRSRFGLAWERGPLTLTGFYNVLGGVTDTTVSPNTDGDSMQTVDLNGVLRFADGSGFLSGADVAISVQNLTNARPPYKKNTAEFLPNYDTTNYSVIGRFVGLTFTKHWQ